MANHLHQQIRGAVKTALLGLATTGVRVYANRLHAMDDPHLPGLRITLDEEQAVGVTVHSPQIHERTLELSVECCAKATQAAPNIDDTLDQMSQEVEIALAGGVAVSGRTLEVRYAGMHFDDELSNKPAGVKRLRFSISFMASADAPDVFA